MSFSHPRQRSPQAKVFQKRLTVLGSLSLAHGRSHAKFDRLEFIGTLTSLVQTNYYKAISVDHPLYDYVPASLRTPSSMEEHHLYGMRALIFPDLTQWSPKF
jgi:hypothetical protein